MQLLFPTVPNNTVFRFMGWFFNEKNTSTADHTQNASIYMYEHEYKTKYVSARTLTLT